MLSAFAEIFHGNGRKSNMPEDFSSSGSSPMKRYLQQDTRDSQHLQLALRCRSLNFYVLINELLHACTEDGNENLWSYRAVRFTGNYSCRARYARS